ncbi:MAG: UdgX family uracil-DNA binding protein [Pirellulaceae bacterium]|nr:UdgX family uracil-DNA binding protein [Pirellulaceae bacterium]
MHQFVVKDFEQWRVTARQLRVAEVPPDEVQFLSEHEPGLFATSTPLTELIPAAEVAADFRVPKEFLQLATDVGYHRDAHRWELLYRVLWRLTTNEPKLLQLATDDDVQRLLMMQKAVSRDAHKMKAFVRFREVIQDDQPHFVAWHRPDHRIVRKVAPFFSRRFKAMHWTILTPDESVSWDQHQLNYFDGVDRSAAPTSDQLEELWRTYYANIFNPARIKIKAMKAEMPVRHWATLPEASIIDDILQAAPQRVQAMLQRSEGFATSARDFFPTSPATSLIALAEAAQRCRACDLCCHATQVVFGQGPQSARIVIVGEQPGDQEDLVGAPFVGPAGQVLDQALASAGLDRNELYITNAVKHFKFEQTGTRRLHKRPDAREIRACRPWFEEEWSQSQAAVLICLGATAATALIAPGFRLQQQRGLWVTSKFCKHTLATWHPSSILRLQDEKHRAARFEELVMDLRCARATASSI